VALGQQPNKGQQIAGWSKQSHTDNPAVRISHGTIYRSLFTKTRGVLRTEPGIRSPVGALPFLHPMQAGFVF